MKLELIKPIKALNKAYLKEKVNRNHIELFKKNLQQLLSRINEQESEERLKNVIVYFLKDTCYKDQFEINTKDRNDLVLHTGRKAKSDEGYVLENTIIKLKDEDALRNFNNLLTFGATKEGQLFNVALELCITWVNRMQFIKLPEAQLYKYHKGKPLISCPVMPLTIQN